MHTQHRKTKLKVILCSIPKQLNCCKQYIQSTATHAKRLPNKANETYMHKLQISMLEMQLALQRVYC